MASNDQYTDSTFSFTVDGNSLFTSSADSTITINTTADTTYTYDTDSSTYSFNLDNITTHWDNNSISPSEVERMCMQYPALEKVWRNFKSVYDMCKQDYEGKKKSGEVDDLPF